MIPKNNGQRNFVCIQTPDGQWIWVKDTQLDICIPPKPGPQNYLIDLNVGCYEDECMFERSDQRWMTKNWLNNIGHTHYLWHKEE